MKEPERGKKSCGSGRDFLHRKKHHNQCAGYLKKHYPMAHQDGITGKQSNDIGKPIVKGREVALHHPGYEISLEKAWIERLMKRIDLLHGIVGSPEWIEPVAGKPFAEEIGVEKKGGAEYPGEKITLFYRPIHAESRLISCTAKQQCLYVLS